MAMYNHADLIRRLAGLGFPDGSAAIALDLHKDNSSKSQSIIVCDDGQRSTKIDPIDLPKSLKAKVLQLKRSNRKRVGPSFQPDACNWFSWFLQNDYKA